MIEESYNIIKLKNLSFNIRTSPNTDKGLIEGVILKNDYCLEDTDFKGIETIVDIGGHVGSFSIFYSKYVKNIVSFEPEPVSHSLYLKNIEMNKIGNIRLVNKAVSANKGKLKFYLGATAGRNTLCDVKYTHPKGVIEVDCEEINEIFDIYNVNSNSLLKVDIEGIEYELFSKISDKTFDRLKIIVLEAHQYPDKDWKYFSITSLLEKKGFKVVKIKPITVNKHVCAFNIKAIKC